MPLRSSTTVKSFLAAFICTLALSFTGAAAASPLPPSVVFTVYGTQTTQSLVVDGNGNGNPDPGDVLSISGPLSNSGGAVIGRWGAHVQFIDSTTASVRAQFLFWAGTLLVKGSFNPSAGPPPSLRVFAGSGTFQGYTGRLTVGDGGPNVNAFTFSLSRIVGLF